MMTRSGRNTPLLRLTFVSALAILAACTPQSAKRAQVDVKGTDPAVGVPKATPGTQQGQSPGRQIGGDVIDYGDYKAAVARQGDTVTTLAARIGMSASSLGSYNGLPPNQPLQTGQELVLPPGSTVGTQIAAADPNATQTPGAPARPNIEQQPLDGAATDAVQDGKSPDEPWTPKVATDALDRATGLQKDGTLGQPPSAKNPVPADPSKTRNLESPDLGQYQTQATEQPQPLQQPEPNVQPQPQPQPEIAAAPQQPAPNIKLQRPVQGRIAVGFDKSDGPNRNDGVDFAAPAGAPVVAAAAGEVALVSQSFGGLGTIVLVRHPDELLTVYGRIDKVSIAKGDRVTRGQRIGVVAESTDQQPRMHFEVRRGAESLDPMQFL